LPLTIEGKKTLQEEGGLEMEKESKADKPGITNKDLVESLLLISEASKTLALEIMLLPKDEAAKGGGENGTEPNNSQ